MRQVEPLPDALRWPRATVLRALVAAIVVGSLGLRCSLIHVSNVDIEVESSWYDHLDQRGLGGLGDDFSVYPPPFLYLLYVATLLPVSKVAAIKLLSIAFDYLLAVAVGLVVEALGQPRARAIAAGVVTLGLPTVWLNSSLWGQCDVMYASFVVLTVWAAMTDRTTALCVLFATALSFKVQAGFVAPMLLAALLYGRVTLRGVGSAVLTFAVLWLPVVGLGRNVWDLLSTYPDQAGREPATQLTANAPNLYEWVGIGQPAFERGGEALAVVLGLAIVLAAVWRGRWTPELVLQVSLTSVLALPFVLPHMHERYFFTGEVLLLVVAFAAPRRAWAVVVMQVVTALAYAPFLTAATPIPLADAAVGTLAVLAGCAVWLLDAAQPTPVVVADA